MVLILGVMFRKDEEYLNIYMLIMLGNLTAVNLFALIEIFLIGHDCYNLSCLYF